MPYIDWTQPHAGSAEVLFTGMFDEPAGTVARTVPRTNVNTATLTFSGGTGVPTVRAIALPAGLSVNNLACLSGSTAEVAGTHFWMALMDINSNVLSVTADQTGASYVASGTFLKNAVTNAPYFIQYTGLYYIVVGCSATTTMPTLAGAGNNATGLNVQMPILYGVLGAQAAPPAIGANLGAVSNVGGANLAAWIS